MILSVLTDLGIWWVQTSLKSKDNEKEPQRALLHPEGGTVQCVGVSQAEKTAVHVKMNVGMATTVAALIIPNLPVKNTTFFLI